MKLALDPMPQARMRAVDRINGYFAALADPHRDAAHAQKRQWAASNDPRLAAEAELRGITVAELAALILSKPDALAARELARQQALARVAAAASPPDLALALTDLDRN